MSTRPETKPRHGDWCMIEHMLSGFVYVDPRPEDPPETRLRLDLARVVRVDR